LSSNKLERARVGEAGLDLDFEISLNYKNTSEVKLSNTPDTSGHRSKCSLKDNTVRLHRKR